MTVVEEDRDLERRVERLEDQQSSWWQIMTDLLTRESRRDKRLARMESDIGSLRTDMTEVKTQLNRGELANARRFDRIDAQLETIRGLFAGREERGG